MGVIENTLSARGIGSLVEGAEGLSEVFVPNATRAMELASDIHQATLQTAASEFQYAGNGWFDRMINGLNRLPRPMLALGTLGLFVYAMADPEGFGERMMGLQQVPEPLWWLLGAIVSFYFGARELHYQRLPRGAELAVAGAARPRARRGLRERLGSIFSRNRSDVGAEAPEADAGVGEGADNPALSDWRGGS